MLFFNELKNEGRIFYPAVLLDDFLSHKMRKYLRGISFILMAVMFLIIVVIPYAHQGIMNLILPQSVSNFLVRNIYNFRGIFLILAVIWLKTYWLEVFYLSHYFRKGKVDYEVAKLAYHADEDDMTGSFLTSGIGQYVISKLGINNKLIRKFIIDKRRNLIKDSELKFHFNARNCDLDDDKVVNLTDYLKAIFDADHDFQNFLKRRSITEEEFFGAVMWTQSIYWKKRNEQRFWSRENLIRIPSIGRQWYFDSVDYLHKYSNLIYESKIYKSLGHNWTIFEHEATILENHLLDQKLNNVMLISDRNTTGMQVVSAFGKMIVSGHCVSKFENKKIYVLKIKNLLLKTKDQQIIRKNLQQLTKQIAKHPDVILVIPNLAEFVDTLMNVNIDSVKILKEILNNQKISIIAVVSKADYFSIVEPDYELSKHFDKQEIPKMDKNFVLRILQDEAYKIETEDDINIIFPVLNQLAEKHLIEKDPIQSSLRELYQIYSEAN